jgi:hypothetical protein
LNISPANSPKSYTRKRKKERNKNEEEGVRREEGGGRNKKKMRRFESILSPFWEGIFAGFCAVHGWAQNQNEEA